MKFIILSLGLLTGGVALAFLMVIHVVKPSLVLCFLAYAISLGGLVLGTPGIVQQNSSRWGQRE
ncbi:MAG TPA: hypothetical protein VFR55_13820 [Dehalococcoidia bacterium]|nr:hypothetical protein [Dehalococcoidia bacterium]